MIARTGLGIDTEARTYHALARLKLLANLRPDAALARQLAFTIGDNDLEPLGLGG